MAGDQKEEETECVNVSQEVIPDLSVSGDNFGTEQLKDPILIRARENVMIDGVPVDLDQQLSFPYMLYNLIQ